MSQVVCEDVRQIETRQAKALSHTMKFTTLFRRQAPATLPFRGIQPVPSFATPPTPPLAVTTPAVHGRVALYLLRSTASVAHGPAPRPMLPLAEALRDGLAQLRETAGLHETEVENLAGVDLFAQAGETIHGGWMDRTLVVDVVVPACHERPRRLGLRAFCLAPGGTWRLTDQREVSRAFGATAPVLGEPADHHAEPGGLACESARRFAGFIERDPQASGFACAIDGVLREAHMYSSPELFRQLWPTLLTDHLAALLDDELVSAAPRPPVLPPRVDEVITWLDRARRGRHVAQSLTPRVTLSACESADGTVSLETLDTAQGHACIHRWVVSPAR